MQKDAQDQLTARPALPVVPVNIVTEVEAPVEYVVAVTAKAHILRHKMDTPQLKQETIPGRGLSVSLSFILYYQDDYQGIRKIRPARHLYESLAFTSTAAVTLTGRCILREMTKNAEHKEQFSPLQILLHYA